MSRIPIAVIGCGIVAHARYFPALHALTDLFDVQALCDSDPAALAHAHRLFPSASTHTTHTDLLASRAQDLDAVILLTGSDHTAILETLAHARIPTLTEKPLAYTRADAERITSVFAGTNTQLHVGYMKRHFPALAHLQGTIAAQPVSSLAIDLIHPPEDTYLTPVIGHGRLVTGDLPSFLDAEAARPDISATLTHLAVPDTDTATRRGYVLLATSVIHDINLLRALLGEPATVPFAHFWNGGLCGRAVFTWSPERTACLTYSYVATGGYSETLTLISDNTRWTLALPSPYLPHAPAVLHTTRGSAAGLPISTIEPYSLADPFQQQLRAFHHTAGAHDSPATDGSDAAADLALIEQIITTANR